jgi:hypothetical protein
MLRIPYNCAGYHRALWYKVYAYIVLIVEYDEYWAEFWGNYDLYTIHTMGNKAVTIQPHSWVADPERDSILVPYHDIFHISWISF